MTCKPIEGSGGGHELIRKAAMVSGFGDDSRLRNGAALGLRRTLACDVLHETRLSRMADDAPEVSAAPGLHLSTASRTAADLPRGATPGLLLPLGEEVWSCLQVAQTKVAQTELHHLRPSLRLSPAEGALSAPAHLTAPAPPREVPPPPCNCARTSRFQELPGKKVNPEFGSRGLETIA